MSDLTPRELELVALGAAMGSNCVPCVEYHIPEARRVGLGETEIRAAILHADKVRQVPARKSLQAALKLLPATAAQVPNAAADEDCGCGNMANAAQAASSKTTQARDMMSGMMSKMIETCRGHDRPAEGQGCGCG